ncbi:hypothetical protein ACI76W_11225 [Capnocytophaga canimorsus]|uniref:hypothetical protein n=1 Tax=Capnocytophaga canimorsus TaxID=28188 RepID=UPI003859213A
MSLNFKIRENLNGKYVFFHSDELKEGVEYALKTKVPQIQIRDPLGIKNEGIEIDFQELEKLSKQLRVLSIQYPLDNIVNFESIYSLSNLRRLYLEKQKYKIDVSKFPKIEHLGATYWKGLLNLDKTHSLQSLVLLKLPNSNLEFLSGLKKLKILHIYSSKIENLSGIEKLPIEELSLARNNCLENILLIEKLNLLKSLEIEKCKKIIDFSFLDELKEKINIRIIK